MKSFLLMLAFCCIPLLIYSQKKSENIVATSGNTIITSEGSMDWVIGENLIDHQILFGNNAPEDVFPQLKKQTFVAFPTITPDKVYIVSQIDEWKDLNIMVYDVSNRWLLTKKWKSNPMEIDLSGFKSGLYIIRLIIEKQSVYAVFKVVKQ
nr:T9SS type A sorting domain-containing protein [uncultured Carboxylicivirga sp.]